MARKKTDNLDDWNRSLGYSDDAMKALKSGSYGQLTNRKAQSIRSEDQARIANPTPIPSLAGMKPINDEWQSSFSKARQYQQNVANEEKKFQYNDAIAARNTLDKKDQNYIDGLVSRLGNPDSVRKYLGDKKAAEWEQKYGKSIDQIYDDYVADQDNAKMREGKEHSVRSTLAATLGEFGKPLQAIPHLVSNLIDPDSEIAKGTEKARAEYSDQLKRLKAGVKENLGDTGDKVYDTATQVGGRMLLNSAGSVLGGPLGSAILTGLADYSDQMDALNLRPDMSGRRKAATALAHGTVEGAGNAITRGILDGLPTVSGVGGKLLNVGKGAGNAAVENGVSEAVEMGLDTLINGENSERELNKAIYMSQGMSEAEAEEQVQNDQWDRVLGAAGTGALFGGFTKGLGEAFDSAKKIPALKGLFDDTQIEETKAPVENAKPKSSGDPDRVPEGWTAEDLENATKDMPDVTKPDIAPSIHNVDGQLLDTVKVPEYTADSNVYFEGTDADISLAEAQEKAITDTFKNIVSDPEFNALSFKNGTQEVYVSPSTIGNGYRVSYTIDGVPTGHHDYSVGEMDALSQNLRELAGNGGEDIRIQRKSDISRTQGTAPVENTPNTPKDMPEAKGLVGDDLKAAQDRVTSNKSKIKALENEIKIIENDPKNKYRGNLKKSAKADIEQRKAQIAELKQDNKVTSRQIKGDATPVIEQLDSDSANRINNFKKEIRKIGNMWVDSDGKQLANDVNAALDRYVESGSQEDFNEFARDLWQLHASANKEYSSKSGNVSRYSDYYGDVEDGIFGAALRDNGLIPNKAIRDFHSGRIDDDNVKVTPTETAPNEPLPVDDSGIVPPDGNIPPNGNVPPEGGDKIRSFSKRGSQDETLPEEIRNTLSEDYYKVVHNADVEARADSLFVPENLTQTRSNLDRAVESHDPASALLSYKLAKAYVDNGDYDAATDVLENVSAELTRMGQFTQAAKLAMLQNDPMAAMRSYMRDLEKLNEWGSKKYKGKWNKLELSEEDIDAISSIQKGDKDALNAITDQLNEKFARQIPANWWDKAVGASKTAMLLNLRTQSRNILANMATLPIRSASDRVSAVGQNIVHLFNPDMKVTQSVLGGTKEQKAIAEQLFEQNKAGILGENKMKDSVKSDILSQRQIFNDDAFATWVDNLTHGGIQKLNQKFGANGNKSTMETLQNLTYWLMGDIGDTPFVKKNFVNRLASYMKAQGINKIEDVPDDAIAIATQEALKATFKDDNAFTKTLQGIKQKTGKFGEVALPFVKTPANLTMRAIDYSPAGLINTFRKIKSGADANAVVDELSKNLTGSAMIFLGYKLAEKGILSGSYSDDPDEAQFQRQQGMLENAIHIGDKYFTYDWTQPAATPLVLGQTIYEAVKASDKQNAEVKDVVNAMFKGGLDVADTVINSSPLQSLADIMGGDEYSDKSVARNVANEIIEFPQRFVPSVLGATARTIDPVMRDTYIDDDSLTGTIGNNLRQIESKIPFLSKRLPVSYDTWGNPRTRSDSVGEAFVAQMVNPGTMGNKNETPLDAEIQRLFDATGNNAVFPAKAGRSLDLGNDGNLTLTNRQHSEYQKALGKKSYSYVEAITKSDEYKNLSDDQKASIIAKAYKLSNAMVKEEMFKHTTDDDKKLKEVARTGDANAVAKYLFDKNKADNLGISMDKYQKLESEAPGSAEQWLADKDNALNTGFTKKDGTVNMDSYEKAKEIVGDDPNALAAYSDYAKQGFTKNADRLYYLENNPAFTNEQKGQMLTSFKEDGTINGQTAQGAYDLGGFEGMYYYYLLKNNAESNGKSGINKKEKAAYFASDAPELDELWNYNQDLYYFLMNNIK